MVKAILPETYLIGAFVMGPSLEKIMARNFELGLDNWILAKGRIYRDVSNILNLRKGLPNGRIVSSHLERYYVNLTRCTHSKGVVKPVHLDLIPSILVTKGCEKGNYKTTVLSNLSLFLLTII